MMCPKCEENPCLCADLDAAFRAADEHEVARRYAQPSSLVPRPWTDAHRREAFVRLCELAIEWRRLKRVRVAHVLTSALGEDASEDERSFRAALDAARPAFDDALIDREVALVRQRAEQPVQTLGRIDPRPIDMILHCPLCGAQHVDAPEPEKGWTNPPHRSHLCHACGCVWRPADVATNGVEVLTTVGSADTWTPADQDSAASRLHAAASAPRVIPCVAAIVTDSAGRLLLVRTPRGWEVPGGRMEPGETWRDAVAREVFEETGLGFARFSDRPRVLDGMPVNGAKYQSIIIVARGTARGEPVPAAGDAVREARWFARGEPPADLSQIATAELVREWAAEPTAPPPVIVGRYPTVDEVRAHAAAHPYSDGMGAWLASFRLLGTRRPVIVTLGARHVWIEADKSMREVVLVNDLDGGNAIEDDFDADTTWRPLTADGLPVVVGSDAEQRGDDRAHAAPIWTPPPGVSVEVLRGSIDGPLLVAMVTLDPGAEVPQEVHERHGERIAIVSGVLSVREEATEAWAAYTTRLEPDGQTVLTIVPCQPHTISNASTETAMYISIMRRVEA